MRQLCLGLEVVLPTGEIWNGLRRLKKDNTGYDLRDLFIGAEGTLGVITGAVLKLFPQPLGHQVAFAGLQSVDDALTLFKNASSLCGTALTGFELMPRIGVEFTTRHIPGVRDPLETVHPWYVLIDISTSDSAETAERMMTALLEQGYEGGLILRRDRNGRRQGRHVRRRNFAQWPGLIEDQGRGRQISEALEVAPHEHADDRESVQERKKIRCAQQVAGERGGGRDRQAVVHDHLQPERALAGARAPAATTDPIRPRAGARRWRPGRMQPPATPPRVRSRVCSTTSPARRTAATGCPDPHGAEDGALLPRRIAR